MSQPPPVLVLAVGNPSRGDDALGPEFLARLEQRLGPAVRGGQLELLTDFQLQVEHALDLREREQVVFVDASLKTPAPFSFARVRSAADDSFTSHALSPSAVLEAWARVESKPAPPCFALAIAGEQFELGEPLSSAARRHLQQAVDFFCAWWERRGG